MTTELIVVRHGETEANVAGRWQGHLDGVLSAKGKTQGFALGKRLKEVPFTALYSSDLGRAQDTALLIRNETGHEILLEPRLRERNFGIFQGLNAEEIERKYPAAWSAHASPDPDSVVPEGESAREFMARALAGLEGIARKHLGQTVVVVSHGGVLGVLLRRATGIPLHVQGGFVAPNAGYNHFDYLSEPTRWLLHTWGDTSHLGSPLAQETP